MPHSPIIRSQSVHVWYGDVLAVHNVTLDIPRHQITALIGASGSGKSSFLRSINRMIDHVPGARVAGQMLFAGSNVLDDVTDVVWLRRKVGMVFQNPTPFPKSIYDNVAYGLEVQGVYSKRVRWNPFRPRMSATEVESSRQPLDIAVVQSLKEAALWDEVKDRLHVSAYSLSGGQQQRLCIARAIAIRPEVLLLDEPCSDLDPISTKHIEELLLTLKTQYTIMIVTHNMHQARRVADYVAFFHTGDLVEFGETEHIFSHATQPLTREYVQGAFG